MTAPHFLAPLLASQPGRHVLWNARTGLPVATRVEGAFDSRQRRRGLLGRTGLDSDAALILAPCAGIHTLAMRFPIDVVFARRNGEVCRVRGNVRPWRIAIAPGAFAAIELAAGTAARAGLRPGDRLHLIERSSV
jgi:uncharacterized membrane protein (UPF0127 family)